MDGHLEIELALVVMAFAAAQSVFGVGLLVFGTPTLLLLGFPFREILVYLLPCSIVISGLQVLDGGGVRPPDGLRRRFLIYTAPGVLLGTALILAVGKTVAIKPIVGATLLLSAAVRIVAPMRRMLQAFVRRHLTPLLVGLGILHGLSNLGGGVLTVIVGSLHQRKDEIRKHVAFAYGLMAVVQLVTLFVTTRVAIVWWMWLALPALSATTFLAMGQRLFKATPDPRYQLALTTLIFGFGLVLMIPS